MIPLSLEFERIEYQGFKSKLKDLLVTINCIVGRSDILDNKFKCSSNSMKGLLSLSLYHFLCINFHMGTGLKLWWIHVKWIYTKFINLNKPRFAWMYPGKGSIVVPHIVYIQSEAKFNDIREWLFLKIQFFQKLKIIQKFHRICQNTKSYPLSLWREE